MGLARRHDSGVASADAASKADAAMTLLTRAVGSGFRNPDPFPTESVLNRLRDRPDFRALMMDPEFPTEPFSPFPAH